MAAEDRLRICFATSEFAPYAKAGGLADVSAALTGYLHAAGHDVRVLLPAYRQVLQSGLDIEPVEALQDLALESGPLEVRYSIDRTRLPGTGQPVYLLRCDQLYDRDGLYSGDEFEYRRFVLLSRAAIDMCRRLDFAPDIFHVNDWHTSLIPLYLKDRYAGDAHFRGTRTVLTIHNIAYQGIVSADRIAELGVDGLQSELDGADLEGGQVNLLKTGVLHADMITTVSPTYAQEIQHELGMGLQDALRSRLPMLVGILNGVDYDVWDPARDSSIPFRYSPKRLAGKKKDKQALLSKLDLAADAGVPLVGMVTRLTEQKGIDLVEKVLPGMLRERPLAVAVLGSGDRHYERFFASLARDFPDRVGFFGGHDDALAHLIEAGSDMFLMPSRFEPCGLNQMYSLRYGTIPIVRLTGGLADTVEHFDPDTGLGTGVVFRDYDDYGLRWALTTALDWFDDGRLWRRIVKNAMARDFSWDRQGAAYVDVYRQLTGR